MRTPHLRSSSADPTSRWLQAGAVTVGFVVLLWLVEIYDAATPSDLDLHGIRSRDDEGLLGILVAPLLHAGWGHLEANSGPLLVLGFLVAVVSVARYAAVLAWSWLVSGAGVWLVGPTNGITLGASGLVFGLLTYLLVVGFLEKRPVGILVSVGVFLVYGGVLLGVLPGQPGISWQGHLFGALGGLLAAYSLAGRSR